MTIGDHERASGRERKHDRCSARVDRRRVEGVADELRAHRLRALRDRRCDAATRVAVLSVGAVMQLSADVPEPPASA